MKQNELIPTCVGQWEFDDEDCNGDPDSLSEADHAPCAWRKRCYGFQLLLRHKKEVPARHLKVIQVSARMKELSGFSETAQPRSGTVIAFKRLCHHALQEHATPRQLRRFRSAVAIPESLDGPKARPAPTGKVRRDKTIIRNERRSEFTSLHRRLRQEVISVFPDRKILKHAYGMILPGHMRFATLSHPKLEGRLLHRELDGRDRVILSYVYLPSSRKLKVKICVNTRKLASVTTRAQHDELKPIPTVFDNLPTCIPRANRAVIKTISIVLRKLVDKGAIVLMG